MSIRKDARKMEAGQQKATDLRVRVDPDTFYDLKKLAGTLRMDEKQAMAYAVKLALSGERGS